jgi:hypothetical protein
LFWAVSLLTHNLIVKCLIVQHSSLPFREQILANRVFTTPPYAQGIKTLIGINTKRIIMHKLSEITVLYLLWCALNYILTYVSRKTSYSSQDCLSLTYHSSLDIFTTITHSAFYKPDHGKITTLRVSNQILIHYLIIGLSRQNIRSIVTMVHFVNCKSQYIYMRFLLASN